MIVKDLDSAATRTLTTDDAGHFRESGLPPGHFAVRAAKSGFADQTRTGINLADGQEAVVEDRHFSPATVDACASGHEFATTDCALTWHGITLYGAYDVGIGGSAAACPLAPPTYEGESLVNRNANHSRFLIEPNNLSQTGLGIRGKEQFLPGWSMVFNASTGINPQSGQLANASVTDIVNNGLPRKSYSEAIDGARAGQPFNDEFYLGLASASFGTLTFGRQRALGTNTMLAYDPPAAVIPFPTSAITIKCRRWRETFG